MKKSRTVARPTAVESPRHLPLVDLLVDARTELFELAVRSGLKVLETMLEEDRTAMCGPRYTHDADRQASRAGTVSSEVVLGGRKVAVRRLVVTHAVKDREPIEPAELVSGIPVLAFVELSNADGVERDVVVTFEREGRPAVGHAKLHVPGDSPRFRTWARTHNLSEVGTWEAVVRGEDGKELGRQPFELLAMLDPA